MSTETAKPKRPILTLKGYQRPEPKSLPQETVCKLAEIKWPVSFNRKKPRPLPIGTDKRLAEQFNITRKSARRFLGKWTRSERYQKAIAAPNSVRHSLDMPDTYPITEAEREHARAELAKRKEAKQ